MPAPWLGLLLFLLCIGAAPWERLTLPGHLAPATGRAWAHMLLAAHTQAVEYAAANPTFSGTPPALSLSQYPASGQIHSCITGNYAVTYLASNFTTSRNVSEQVIALSFGYTGAGTAHSGYVVSRSSTSVPIPCGSVTDGDAVIVSYARP